MTPDRGPGQGETGAALELYLVEQATERLIAFDATEGKLFAEILGVVEAAGYAEQPRTPAAVIAPIAERGDEAVAPRVPDSPQRFTVTIGVVHVVQAANDRKGDRARDRLSRALTRSRRALAGWQPPGQREAMTLRRGRIVRVDGGRVSWVDEYEIGHWPSQGGIAAA